MTNRPAEIDWLEEAFDGALRVTARRMFGGWGVYGDGLFFALIAADTLWLKADALSDAAWDAAGCERFTYHSTKRDTTGSMNYRRVPDDALDDAEAMRHWVGLALEAASRAGVTKAGAKKRDGATERRK